MPANPNRQSNNPEVARRQQMERSAMRLPLTATARDAVREILFGLGGANSGPEDVNLVQRLIDRKLTVEEFDRLLVEREQLNSSWANIQNVQNAIRKKINDLYLRVEAYAEAIPEKRLFDSLLKQVKTLNADDAKIDHELKMLLNRLIRGAPAGAAPVLSANDALGMYNFDPTQSDFRNHFTAHQAAIDAFDANIWGRLGKLKSDERNVNESFARIDTELKNILQANFSNSKKRQQQQKMLKTMSKSIGITLTEGTVVSYNDAVNVARIYGTRPTAKITKIEFEEVPVTDHSGNRIDTIPGVPMITLAEGGSSYKITLGRFKKWADISEAEEVTSGWDGVNDLLGLTAFGFNLKAGDDLWYQKPGRDSDGNFLLSPNYVRISKIENNRVYFQSPVTYHDTISDLEDPQPCSVMTFGKFIKWWRRQDAEKSVSLVELRKALKVYNKQENTFYGRSERDFPSIIVEKDEELRLEDGYMTDATYKIKHVDESGVHMNDGSIKSFPAFMAWVKENNVIGVPKKEKTLEQKQREDRLDFARNEEKKRFDSERKEKIADGTKKNEETEKYLQEIKEGTIGGRLKKLWWGTTFLSVQDLWKMTVEVGEFIKRKHDRRSKGRYGKVGSRLPGTLGTEFKRVAQDAETEEVNKNKAAMANWGVDEIRSTLNNTSNNDIAKACIIALVEKGMMRWDDPEFWETMNRLTARYTDSGAELNIPKPHLIPDGESGENMVIKAVNKLWGEGGAQDWFQQNSSKYNSAKTNFEFKFKQLENDPKNTGGPGGELERMLKDWRSGKYVDPAEYEEYIDAAISMGKMSGEKKVFYLIAGVLSKQGESTGSPSGQSLLHFDRIGELNSKHTQRFALLDFFTQHMVFDHTLKDKDTGEYGRNRKINLEDLKKWKDEYFKEDFDLGKPKAGFSSFMWEYMLMDDAVRIRISKGLRGAEQLDHEDAPLYIPLASLTEINELTGSSQGNKKNFSPLGYANGYPGFNQYFVSLRNGLEDEIDPERRQKAVSAMATAVSSFVQYDLILDNRYKKTDGSRFARLDRNRYDSNSAVEPTGPKVRLHQDQLRNLMLEIGAAYGLKEKLGGKDMAYIFDEKTRTGSMSDQEEVKKQKEYEANVDKLQEMLPDLIISDGGEKALDIITRCMKRDDNAKNGLRGMLDSRSTKHKRLKAS